MKKDTAKTTEKQLNFSNECKETSPHYINDLAVHSLDWKTKQTDYTTLDTSR